jgi:hypothetical protein
MRTVLLGVLIAAAAGSEASATPAWCNAIGKANLERPPQNKEPALQRESMGRALYHIVLNTCMPDEDAKRVAADIEAARQHWSAQLQMTDADWADAADYAANTKTQFGSDFIGVFLGTPDQRFAYSTLSPIQQFIAITNGMNRMAASSYSDSHYLVDALGANVTETGRFAHVLKCIRGETAIELALCDGDVKLLDRKKVLDEVRADNAPGAHKMKIRMLLATLDERLVKYEASVKKWRDKDPAYGQMFDIAGKTRGEWDQLWSTDGALFELALAMDDARETRSKKALDGCAAKTRPAWKQAVSAIPASKFVGFRMETGYSWIEDALAVVVGTPRGYLAGAALFTCFKADASKDHFLNTLGSVLAAGPGLRGPRLASHVAIRRAQLSLDEQGAAIEFPRVGQGDRFEGYAQSGYFATVAKISKPDDKGMVTIAFATKLEKQEQCLESRPAKQVARILSNGTLVYDRDCLKWGTVAIDRTPEDQVVKAEYLAGLKPGMNAYVGGGAVMAVFPKGKKTPSAIAGVPVK